MKIIVVSDTHGDIGILEDIVNKYESEVDAMIHCGDYTIGDHDILEKFITVRGNNDLGSKYPREMIVDVCGKRILILHGDQYNVDWGDLSSLEYYGLSMGVDLVLYGHSHVFEAHMVENTIFVNPGSTRMPRAGKYKTYALIESNTNCEIKFYNSETDELINEKSL